MGTMRTMETTQIQWTAAGAAVPEFAGAPSGYAPGTVPDLTEWPWRRRTASKNNGNNENTMGRGGRRCGGRDCPGFRRRSTRATAGHGPGPDGMTVATEDGEQQQ